MYINGWISNLTKNTASARINFDATATDEQIMAFLMECLMDQLKSKGRLAEADPKLWRLKEPIDRDYEIVGKSTARIRLVRVR